MPSEMWSAKYRNISIDDFGELDAPIEYINFCMKSDDERCFISKGDRHIAVILYYDKYRYIECVMVDDLDVSSFGKLIYTTPKSIVRIKIPRFKMMDVFEQEEAERCFADEIFLFNKPFLYRIREIDLIKKEIRTIEQGVYEN